MTARHMGRATAAVGFLDLVDQLGRGGTEEWRALYQRALSDLGLRADIAAALPLVDPELGAARELWGFLLTTIAALEPRREVEPRGVRDGPMARQTH